MSRHTIPGLDATTEVVVGWDPPLMTFFGQVKRRGRMIHWVGASRPLELREIEDLARAMAPHALIDPDVRRQLYQDRDLNQ